MAVRRARFSATDRNDEAAYGRSLTYWSSSPSACPLPRTSPTGSMSISSTASQRSSVASG